MRKEWKSLEDLDSRIQNFNKYKRLPRKSVIEYLYSMKILILTQHANVANILQMRINFKVKIATPIRYNNNFDVKYRTMIKQFRKIKDLDVKYRLLDATDFKEFISIIYLRTI